MVPVSCGRDERLECMYATLDPRLERRRAAPTQDLCQRPIAACNQLRSTLFTARDKML